MERRRGGEKTKGARLGKTERERRRMGERKRQERKREKR